MMSITSSSGMGSNQYQPHWNGYMSESFTYRLRNTDTGAVSNTATVTVYIDCNWDYAIQVHSDAVEETAVSVTGRRRSVGVGSGEWPNRVVTFEE